VKENMVVKIRTRAGRTLKRRIEVIVTRFFSVIKFALFFINSMTQKYSQVKWL
jgi:hypothetical protein